MSTALASLRDRHLAVRNQLEAARKRLEAIIPVATGLTPSRAIAVCLDALSRQPKLLECDPRTIVRSVIHASEIGLELGSPLGEAFIVPFKARATMMVGYRGFVKLIRGAPKVTGIKAVLVRERDEFFVDEGENKIVHKLASGTVRNRGKITHAYSRVFYDNGFSQFEVMDIDELDKIKTESLRRAGSRPTPWKTHEEEMYKKCPVRRQAKYLDLSPLGRRASELDDLEAMRRGELGGINIREGFSAERLAELKSMIKSAEEPVDVIDVEAELVDNEELDLS